VGGRQGGFRREWKKQGCGATWHGHLARGNRAEQLVWVALGSWARCPCHSMRQRRDRPPRGRRVNRWPSPTTGGVWGRVNDPAPARSHFFARARDGLGRLGWLVDSRRRWSGGVNLSSGCREGLSGVLSRCRSRWC